MMKINLLSPLLSLCEDTLFHASPSEDIHISSNLVHINMMKDNLLSPLLSLSEDNLFHASPSED